MASPSPSESDASSENAHEAINKHTTLGEDLDLRSVALLRDRRSSLPPLRETPDWEVHEIDTLGGLRRLAKKLAKAGDLPLDTETYGLGEEPLNARLAVIQVGIPKITHGKYRGEGDTYIVDVVKLLQQAEAHELKTGEEINPLEPLREILEDKNQLKIVQHAMFEQEQFARFGIQLEGVADTEAMASELRPRFVSHALNALAAEIAGYSVSKDEQKSDWGRRPLTKSQLMYAALDPEVTYEVYDRLKRDQAAVEVATDAGFETLCLELLDEHRNQLRVIRPVADEFFPAQLRMARRKAIINGALKAAMEQGVDSPRFANEDLGSASVVRHPRTEPNLAKLKERLPDVADKIIFETASRKDVESELRTRLKLRAKDAKELCEEIFPEIGHTEQKLNVSINFEDFYKRDDAIVPLNSKWKVHQLRNDDLASNFAERISKSSQVSLSLIESEDGSLSLVLGLPRMQQGKVTKGAGTSFVVPEEVLQQMADSKDSRFLETLRGKLADESCDVLCIDAPRIGRFIRSYIEGFDLKLKGNVNDLSDLMSDLRPDMYHFTLRSCCAELSGLLPDPNSAADSAEALFRMERKLSALDALATPKQEFTNPEQWDLIIAEQLAGVLDDTSESMRLLRYLDGGYDVSMVRGQSILEAIRQYLIEKTNDEKGEFSEDFGPVVATISSRSKRELDVPQLKERFPAVASAVLEEKIKKPELEKVLQGFGAKFREKIEDDIYDVVGEGAPTFGIWPKFNRIYMV